MKKHNTQIKDLLCKVINAINGINKTFMIEMSKSKYVVTIKKYRKKRTLPMNSLYWVWLNGLADHIGTTADVLHELYKKKYLQDRSVVICGHEYKVAGSTTGLDTKEMSEYMNKVKIHANEFLNYYLPDPGQIGFDEMIETYK